MSRRWLIGSVLVLCGGSLGGWWWLRADGLNTRAAQDPAAAPASKAHGTAGTARLGSSAPADSGTSRRRPSAANRPDHDRDEPTHIWALDLVDRAHDDPERIEVILLWTGQGEVACLLPAASIPLDGHFEFEGQAVAMQVTALDRTRGYALLLPHPPPTTTVAAPLRLADRDTILAASADDVEVEYLDRSGESQPIRVSLLPDGGWNLDRSLASGTALMTSGELIAVSIGGTQASPLHLLHGWLGRRVGETLAIVQTRLQFSDPRWLLRDIDRVLGGPSPRVVDLRTAIEQADRLVSLARDRELIDAADDRQRLARQLLIHALSRVDPAAAIRTARDALGRYPDHHAIAADLIQLMAAHSDPFEAANRFVTLRSISPDHANGPATDVLIEGLQAYANRLARSEPSEARRALARAIDLFPGRAGLRIALARLLASLGDLAGAGAQAREAAALDPAYAEEAAELSRVPAVGEVVIRFQPGSNAIATTVSVAGQSVGYLVDTGATLTTLPIAIADRLGVRSPSNRRIRINTASGEVEGELARVPWLQLGSIRVEEVDVAVIDLPGTLSGRGLLGMNVLGRLDMRLDGKAGRLVLKQR